MRAAPTLSILVVIGLIVFVLPRWFRRVAGVSSDRMFDTYTERYQKNPDVPQQQLVDAIVRRQALNAGLVGLVTGLGGIVTLPVMLPADLLLSTQIQSAIVEFIARAYGYDVQRRDEQIAMAIALSGSERMTRWSASMMTRFASRIFGKLFSKLIPFVGAATSFAVNYFFARATARIAIRHYEGKRVSDMTAQGELQATTA